MKKFLKIFFISVLSLLGVLIITISVVLWIVFTPDRLTPIVRKQAAKFITCKSEIGSVELTFFSTFPDFGLRVKKFALINPVAGSPGDTLVKVDELVGVVDAKEYWKKKNIILKGLLLTGGTVNVYSDSLGNTNYNIFPIDTTAVTPTTETESKLPYVDIRNFELNDISLQYKDLSLKLNTVIRKLSAKISGTVNQDTISGNVKVSTSMISLEYGGEKYLQQASVQFELPVDVIMSRQFIRLKNATASVNDLGIMLNGTVENDTVSKNMITDLTYKLSSWPVKNIIALVPPSYTSYFKGIDVDGLLSSDGTIKGIMNDKSMPLLDIHLMLEKGIMKYSGFPIPLHDVEGDISLYTDLKSDSLSFVRINRFKAKTPQSAFSTEGLVTHLFSDIYINLESSAGLTLDEFNSMIPKDMKVNLKGNATGQIRSAFSMSQMEKMQIEKMKLSGSVTLTGFTATYDSISLKTSRSKIDFSLPNRTPASKSTKFVYAAIQSDNVEAGKIASYNAFLKNASFTFETSDVRDSTRIPDLMCSFNMDSLSAGMDTMSIAIVKPKGKMSVSPRAEKPDQPHISLSYTNDQLKTIMGKSSAETQKISTELDILNDNTQKDIFLQWLVKGFIDMNQGRIIMAGLAFPIDIPSVKMDFDPETFNIKESKLKIDKSDFALTGNLNNILSYFRGDSILRGKFNFTSNTTDVGQLMALTSGMGNTDSTAVKKSETAATDSVSSGPYIVPKKIDLLLTTNIKQAVIGTDTATNITGNVQVRDGILLLDGLKLNTPAARMQITAMYKTPRKNHLFLGLDYHLMDVEIAHLLKMIPEIDTIMPMLKSFDGKGEFHLAIETYLDSSYNLKMSTLRGAASIKGNDLILMDGQTFSEIAKTLKFSKKTKNKVDSLAAEFTIFRNEIDIYPFLIVMDKYKAVVAGRHNFDMTFDYHISVVDCPIPIKLGIDIKGTPDKMSYKLAPCRYKEYYRPTSRHSVENKQLELRKLIRDNLTSKVIN